MFKECCLECGHLLSNQRDICPFCGWSLQGGEWVENLGSDSRLQDLYTVDIEPDQLFAANAFQSAGL